MTEWCLRALNTPGIWHSLQPAARMSSIIEMFQKNQYVKPLITQINNDHLVCQLQTARKPNEAHK